MNTRNHGEGGTNRVPLLGVNKSTKAQVALSVSPLFLSRHITVSQTVHEFIPLSSSRIFVVSIDLSIFWLVFFQQPMWRIARHRTLKKKIKNNACVLCCFESAEYEQAGMRFDAKRMLAGLDFFFVSLCFPEESVGCCEDTFLQIQKRRKAAEPRTLSSETTSLFGGFGGGGEIPNCERRENLPIVQRIADEIEKKKATSRPFFFSYFARPW